MSEPIAWVHLHTWKQTHGNTHKQRNTDTHIEIDNHTHREWHSETNTRIQTQTQIHTVLCRCHQVKKVVKSLLGKIRQEHHKGYIGKESRAVPFATLVMEKPRDWLQPGLRPLSAPTCHVTSSFACFPESLGWSIGSSGYDNHASQILNKNTCSSSGFQAQKAGWEMWFECCYSETSDHLSGLWGNKHKTQDSRIVLENLGGPAGGRDSWGKERLGESCFFILEFCR